MNKKETLLLYKKLLRLVKFNSRFAEYYPSTNRNSVIIGIKEGKLYFNKDFRDYKDEKNENKLKNQFEIAKGGLARLKQYVNIETKIKAHHKNFLNIKNEKEDKFKINFNF
jgi:hypothetical protein